MGHCLRLNALKSLEHNFCLSSQFVVVFFNKIPVRILLDMHFNVFGF